MTDQEELVQSKLADVHVDEDSKDLSRSEVILKGTLAAGAVYGAAMVGPFVRQALAMSDGGDVGILNYALTLEYLESAFYEEAKRRAGAHGELKSLIDLIARDEDEHVGALTETIKKLGGKPVAKPKFDFPYGNTARNSSKLAQTFEDTGVSAYNGAAPQIKSKEVLGGRRLDRPGRGPARGGDPPAERAGTVSRGVRPLARRS